MEKGFEVVLMKYIDEYVLQQMTEYDGKVSITKEGLELPFLKEKQNRK